MDPTLRVEQLHIASSTKNLNFAAQEAGSFFYLLLARVTDEIRHV